MRIIITKVRKGFLPGAADIWLKVFLPIFVYPEKISGSSRQRCECDRGKGWKLLRGRR
jgi:hypothetical protein